MPTNNELAKKMEQLEQNFESKISDIVEKVFARVCLKLETQPGLTVENLKKEVQEHGKSLAFFNQSVEELEAENKRLKEENCALMSKNAALEKRINDMEQYSRKNNIEIKGIPFTKGEDCLAIVQTIGDKIGCLLTRSDVDIVHRVPSASNTKHLIARFCSRDKKAEFVSKARKARLQTKDIGFHALESHPVYVNEHLTAENKKLFAMALNRKKEMKWQYLWTDDCRIKARKTDDSRVYVIRDERDLRVFTDTVRSATTRLVTASADAMRSDTNRDTA